MSSLPTDEGEPVFTSRTFPGGEEQYDGSNFSTTGWWRVYSQLFGDYSDVPYYQTSVSAIHDRTTLKGDGSGSRAGNLHITNPIGYHELEPSEAILDLLDHQAHTQQGRMRIYGTGDKGPNQWTPVGGGGPNNYNHVTLFGCDEPTFSTYLWTATANDVDVFKLYAQQPSSTARFKEIIVRLWGQVGAGSDEGMCFEITLFANGVQQGSPKLIGNLKFGSDWQRGEVKFSGLDLANPATRDFEIRVKAIRGYVGGSPNPVWKIAELDAIVYYKETYITLIDETAFSTIQTYFAGNSYLLDGDFYDVTFREAILQILAHAPELMLYLDELGRIKPRLLQAYADETDPILIGRPHKNLISLNRVYNYTSRWATEVFLEWNRKNLHVSIPTQVGNPDLELNYLSHIEMILGKDLQNQIEQERPLFKDVAVMLMYVANYLNIWQNIPLAVDLTMNLEGARLEPGDVVAVDEPEVGFYEKKMTVVKNDFNIDDEHFDVLLFDIEFTNYGAS